MHQYINYGLIISRYEDVTKMPLLQNPENHVYLIAALLGILLLVVTAVVVIKKSSGRRRLERLLQKDVHACLREIFLPDGVDGQIWIDCLLANDRGIWVLDIRDYSGDIFAADNIAEWTQLLKGRSLKFQNPIQQNTLREQAVKLLIKDIPVRSLVVFGESARFPKDKPEHVVLMRELHDRLFAKEFAPIDEQRINRAWQQLENAVCQNEAD